MKTTKNLPKATKRNSLVIEGQLWHFRSDRYWSPDRIGGSMRSAVIATRYSDGREVTGSSRETLARVIAQRIIDGSYQER